MHLCPLGLFSARAKLLIVTVLSACSLIDVDYDSASIVSNRNRLH